MKILLATTNKAKIQQYRHFLIDQGHQIVSLHDLGFDKTEVNEEGNSPLENALIKARVFNKLSGLPTFASDEGLYFDDLPEEIQPGVHVRRVNGKRLNDQEMIEYYTTLVTKYGKEGFLNGYFLKAIALIIEDKEYTLEFKIKRKLTNKVSQKIQEGYPLTSIQYFEKYQKFKSELTDKEEYDIMKEEYKIISNFLLEII